MYDQKELLAERVQALRSEGLRAGRSSRSLLAGRRLRRAQRG